jgi:hypothetical protein
MNVHYPLCTLDCEHLNLLNDYGSTKVYVIIFNEDNVKNSFSNKLGHYCVLKNTIYIYLNLENYLYN